ncbi:MAG TPA: response regulator transcription factor, partial [Candidatus Saccharimonadales bacterium]|nr:response regulator transcription factor [Candidatus Saccharimonadales bacterium]
RGPLMATQAGGIRVLLVDDHRMVREAIRSLLKSVQSIDVVGEADNGAEAIASIGKLSPQVVVMDINMPKMDGLAATKLVRRHYPNVAVLGLSVTEDSFHKSAMEKAGAFRVMTKGTHGFDDLCLEIEKAAATMQFLSRARR